MAGSIIVVSLGEKKLSFYNKKFMHNDDGCQRPARQELPMPFKREIAVAAIGFMMAAVTPFAATRSAINGDRPDIGGAGDGDD